MHAVKQFAIFFSILLLSTSASAACKNLVFAGFTNHQTKKDVKILLDEKKTATLAIQCQNPSISRAEVVNNFNLLGASTRVGENIYYNDVVNGGVHARNYILFGDSLHQVSLVLNSKSDADLPRLHKAVMDSLSQK